MTKTPILDRLATSGEDALAGLRQLRWPRALRIVRPAAVGHHPALAELTAELGQLSALLKQLIERPPGDPPPGDGHLHRPYADLATSWWRIWRKTLQPGTERPLEEMRKIFSFLEGLRDTLEQLGIQIIDHTGKEIPVGLSLEVLGYQERAGLLKERVTETVRPTVYYRDKMIQLGRVYADCPPVDDKFGTKPH